MRKILLSLALLGLAGAAAAANQHDDAPLYEGVWTVRVPGQRAMRFELRDWAGTWRLAAAKTLPASCRGKKAPVTVHHSNPQELEFTVWGSSVHKDCPDVKYEFKPVDEKTLEAEVEGGKVTMTRAKR